jgi:hypothetical protein
MSLVNVLAAISSVRLPKATDYGNLRIAEHNPYNEYRVLEDSSYCLSERVCLFDFPPELKGLRIE